ncbi:hypothetical protein SCACP_06500 [Sporomusa carbonis]
MHAINFSLPECYSSLINRSKLCTIRHGDKTGQYTEGEIVSVLFGGIYTNRTKLYTAFIDQVLVKPLSLLTNRDINGENLNLNTVDEFIVWYNESFGKIINPSDLVTVIYFSEIIE